MLWRRLDLPGHESAQLLGQASGWQVNGTAVFLHDHNPCRLDYQILCDEAWQTRSAKVSGWVGDKIVDIYLTVDSAQRWHFNGKECDQVEGCIDLDLNFSPSTNLLPIRRLNLEVGQAAAVNAAWLRFPSFRLERLEQVYHRLSETTYRYESNGGRFVAELQVNTESIVVEYPHLWVAELS